MFEPKLQVILGQRATCYGDSKINQWFILNRMQDYRTLALGFEYRAFIFAVTRPTALPGATPSKGTLAQNRRRYGSLVDGDSLPHYCLLADSLNAASLLTLGMINYLPQSAYTTSCVVQPTLSRVKWLFSQSCLKWTTDTLLYKIMIQMSTAVGLMYARVITIY